MTLETSKSISKNRDKTVLAGYDDPFFDYELDSSLIALTPPRQRGSRLLVANAKTKQLHSRKFNDITGYLLPGDLVILNNSKVFPAKLIGTKTETGAAVDLLLEKRIRADLWKIITRVKSRNPVPVHFHNRESGEILHGEVFQENGSRFLRFEREIGYQDIDAIGLMPIPPYIERLRQEKFHDRLNDISDRDDYQNIYASNTGSIAAPTAGFHFSETLLDEFEKHGIELAYLTLHVGYSTFKPIRDENISNHEMEPESYIVPEETLNKLISAKQQGRRVVSVGTTSTRVIESISGAILSGENRTDNREITGKTSLFIYPGYKFKIIDLLITNFHLPKSTLLLLVTAFGGDKLIKDAYKKAMEEKFLFYSFGDSMLIIPG